MVALTTINRSRDSDYHTQRNNRRYPHAACNVTAYVMAAKQAGIQIAHPEDVQPEDFFMQYLRTEDFYRRIRGRYPWAFETLADGSVRYFYQPNEIHELLAEGFNELAGRTVARFTTEATRADLALAILDGAGVVVSGSFPYRGGYLNHVVSLAGFRTNQRNLAGDLDPAEIAQWIIDDPYGDFHTDYHDHRGNNVTITVSEWREILKPRRRLNHKWAHIIRRP